MTDGRLRRQTTEGTEVFQDVGSRDLVADVEQPVDWKSLEPGAFHGAVATLGEVATAVAGFPGG